MSIPSAESTLQAVDETAIPIGANEELAGPPHVEPPAPDPAAATRPVSLAERVSSIDLLRGFSLMGILIMNITDFGLPSFDYAYPLSTVHPVFNGPHWRVNTTLWFLRWLLAEGKMRAMFSLLFGAGVILLTGRAESRGAGVRTADIYTRRNMWLMLFGLLHCYLIWNGDILYFYASAALIFLFPFRNLKPKTLIWTATVFLLLNTIFVNGGQTMGTYMAKRGAEKALAAQAKGAHLTKEQYADIEGWHKSENRYRPPVKDLYKNIAEHKSYAKAFVADAPDGFQAETLAPYAGFGDWVGMMLLGMALFKNGFLTAKLSTRAYALTAIIGLVISWSIIGVGAWFAWKSGFDQIKTLLYLQAPYDIPRVAGALGNAAVIILLMRAGLFKWIFARIAAVGQMALSNYLLTSISMRTLFVWSPLHWYGYLEYYKLYYCVAAMWAINLIFSSLWLRYFRFGPVEWCWRSLTYWKRQPMRLTASE